jgi:hypothetical protein
MSTLAKLGAFFDDGGTLMRIESPSMYFDWRSCQKDVEEALEADTTELLRAFEFQLIDRHSAIHEESSSSHETILVLLCGCSDSRLGIWSMKALLEDGRNVGSQIPFIDWAMSLRWSVLTSCLSSTSLVRSERPS